MSDLPRALPLKRRMIARVKTRIEVLAQGGGRRRSLQRRRFYADGRSAGDGGLRACSRSRGDWRERRADERHRPENPAADITTVSSRRRD
ncbi:MAG TPA: hypothetical protein VGJ20_17275 [Xanthobacteraceae bacterium]